MAASPWMITPITCARSLSPRCACLARTLPTTTGSTASRCEGLATRETWISLSSKTRSAEVPRWYLTSPEPWTSSGRVALPWNSERIATYGLLTMLASTLSRPRWAMPRITSSTPSWLPRLRICSSAGIIDSPPSRPKRLVPVNLTLRNFSNSSASVSRLRMVFLPSAVNWVWLRMLSIRCWIQAFSPGSWMCMNSTPMEPQ